MNEAQEPRQKLLYGPLKRITWPTVKVLLMGAITGQ